MEESFGFAQHWFEFIQSVGIVAGLFLSAYTTRKETKARQISNLIAFNQQYRSIWKEIYERPELARVHAEKADLTKKPVTDQERVFASTLILHLNSVHSAQQEGMFVSLPGLQKDIRISFARPVLRAIWEEMKPFQDDVFVDFIERSRRSDLPFQN